MKQFKHGVCSLALQMHQAGFANIIASHLFLTKLAIFYQIKDLFKCEKVFTSERIYFNFKKRKHFNTRDDHEYLLNL